MTQGQEICTVDANNYLYLTQLNLFPSNGDSINGTNTYVTYNTNSLKIKYIYAGVGVNGNLISI